MLLLAFIVNAVPEAVGVTFAGFTAQLGGACSPQLSTTVLLYPLTAVKVPWNTAVVFACTVCGELEIESV